ncbi:MAG: PDZ domain-containing protein [Woeseiaceae bacterium]|nr:PDZ domain-containing protein [Woeseiaceae bacterium]
MKTLKLIIPVAVALLLAGQAAAQSEEEQALKAAEAREQEIENRLRAAEKQMEEAARVIAELTTERLPQLREIERRIEIIGSGRPRLGINIGGDDEGAVDGVRIIGVTPGSAADEAGLRTGDVITSINGESMAAESAGDAGRKVLEFMEGVEEGDVLDVGYLRDGKTGTLEVEPKPVDMRVFDFRGMPRDFEVPEIHIAPGIADGMRRWAWQWGGGPFGDLELIDLNEGLGKYFGTDSGVLVVSAPKSGALKLEDGDVIRKIDGREATSVKHAMRILGSYQPGENLEIEIMRDKRSRTLEIEIPDDRHSQLWLPGNEPRPVLAPVPARAPRPVEKT